MVLIHEGIENISTTIVLPSKKLKTPSRATYTMLPPRNERYTS